jgi:hypothetical protein
MTHSSLEAVVEIFASNLGIHRINVVNNKGRVAGLLSKTDVVKFIYSHVQGRDTGEGGLANQCLTSLPVVGQIWWQGKSHAQGAGAGKWSGCYNFW